MFNILVVGYIKKSALVGTLVGLLHPGTSTTITSPSTSTTTSSFNDGSSSNEGRVTRETVLLGLVEIGAF